MDAKNFAKEKSKFHNWQNENNTLNKQIIFYLPEIMIYNYFTLHAGLCNGQRWKSTGYVEQRVSSSISKCQENKFKF